MRAQRAFLLYKLGHTDEATKLFKAIGSSTDSSDLNIACWEKATAGIMLESALEDCKQALKLSPGISAYEDSMGMVLLKLGKLDEAIAAFSQVLAKNPNADSFMGRAFAYAGKGNAVAAQKDRTEAITRDTNIETDFARYGLKFVTALPAKSSPASKPAIVSVRRE